MYSSFHLTVCRFKLKGHIDFILGGGLIYNLGYLMLETEIAQRDRGLCLNFDELVT